MFKQRNTVSQWRITVAVEKHEVLHISACAHACVRACSLAYPACNAYGPHSDVICGLWLHIFDIISETERFSKKKKVIEYKMCFHLLYNFCIEHFSSLEEFRKTLS